jgi:hypothetical protein
LADLPGTRPKSTDEQFRGGLQEEILEGQRNFNRNKKRKRLGKVSLEKGSSAMKNLALKRTQEFAEPSIKLVEHIDIKKREDRSWFREFLDEIFSSPDMDYSRFVQLEMKRTPQEMRRNGLY